MLIEYKEHHKKTILLSILILIRKFTWKPGAYFAMQVISLENICKSNENVVFRIFKCKM